jgi:polysaccharide biosynthesis transport protein
VTSSYLPSDREPSSNGGPHGGVPAVPTPASAPVVAGYPGRSPVASGDDLFTPSGLWNLIRRNKWLVLASTLGVVALVGLLCIVLTPTYEAVASVRVLDRKIDIPSVVTSVSNDLEVTTEVQVLESRQLADAVIDTLNLRAVVSPKRVLRSSLFSGFRVAPTLDSADYFLKRDSAGTGFTITDKNADKTIGHVAFGGALNVPGVTATLGPAAAKQGSIHIVVQTPDEAYKQWDKHLKVDRPVRDANVITITYRGKDPELVRDVPNVLAQRFIAQRQSNDKVEARSTAKVLREQLDSLTRELDVSENALQKFREKNQVVSLPDEATSDVQQFALLQADRQSIASEARSLATLMRYVDSQASHTKADDPAPSPYRRLLAFPTLLKNPAATELLHSLATIDDERTALLTRRTPKDPDVLTLTDREHQIEDEVRTIATTYLQGLQAQSASDDSSLSQYRGKMGSIPAKEIEFARLSRQPRVLDSLYIALQSRLKEAEVAEAVDNPSLQLMDPAVTPVEPIRPKPLLWLAAAVVLGLMFGLGGSIARESGDSTVHTRADVLAATGAPVLGMIPRIDGDALSSRIKFAHELGDPDGTNAGHGRRRLTPRQRAALEVSTDGHGGRVVVADPGARSAVAEAYSRLQTNLAYLRPDVAPSGLKTIVITSPLSGDGKTTSAVNLAVTLSRRGQRVLLVDGDLRRGVINRIFGAPRSPGLADVLDGTATLEDAVRGVELGRSGVLHYLPTGTLPSHPAALLDSPTLTTTLARLQAMYDTVILDSPPINIVTDASLLAAHADGVLVVARSGVTASQALTFAMEQLRHVRAPVLGAVLNDINYSRDVAYDGSYKFQGYRDRYYTINA